MHTYKRIMLTLSNTIITGRSYLKQADTFVIPVDVFIIDFYVCYLSGYSLKQLELLRSFKNFHQCIFTAK